MSRFDTAFTPLGMVGVPNSLVIKMESVKNTIKPLIAPGARFRGEPALSFASYENNKRLDFHTCASSPASPLVPTFTNRSSLSPTLLHPSAWL